MDSLTLRYEYDRTPPIDDFGWLAAKVETEAYFGSAGMWVQWQDVAEFAENLKQYPILPQAPVMGKWGFNMLEGDDLILSIEVVPINKAGDLAVRVELADHLVRDHRLRTSFVTAYAELGSFASELSAVMAKSADKAVLRGK